MMDDGCTSHVPNDTVGERVRKLREALRIPSQEKLAADSIDPDGKPLARLEVQKLEGGKNQAGSHRMRFALAKGFGLPLEDMADYLDGKITLDEALGIIRTGTKRAPTIDDRWIELSPRYPNLVAAFEELGGQLPGSARATMVNAALHSGVDLDVGVWVAMGLDLARKLRRYEKTGEPVGRLLIAEDDTPRAGRRR
jgi:transcriptional regulator with XRE-family HTH domain